MKQIFGFVLAALALTLAACSSSPVHYYTLVAPSAPGGAINQPVPFLLDILPIGLPEQLDQPQLVVRQGTSGIIMADGERWAGPLGNELRQALSAELSARLATRDIAGLVRPANKSVLRIKLLVRRFDLWPGQKFELEADWNLAMVDASGNTQLAQLFCHGRFSESAKGSYPELVQAGQRAISALAARIAADARGEAGSPHSECAG